MTVPPKVTSTKTALQALWRRAGRAESPIPLLFATTSEATKFRLALYRSVQLVRTHPGLDPALFEIVNTCSITVDGANKAKLWLGKGFNGDMGFNDSLASALKQAGVGPEDIKSAAELGAAEALRKLEAFEDPAAERVIAPGKRTATPYYTR